MKVTNNCEANKSIITRTKHKSVSQILNTVSLKNCHLVSSHFQRYFNQGRFEKVMFHTFYPGIDM